MIEGDLPQGAQRLAAAFARARERGRAALIPYATGGFPTLERSLELARRYAAAGADVVEFGIPFSDPLADGPTIQRAAAAALATGTTPTDVLGIARRLADDLGPGGPPIVLLAYMNTVLAGDGGPERFLADSAAAGVAGLVVPDLPVDEASATATAAAAHGIALVPFAAATSSDARLAAMGEAARAGGFVYCVATAGVTGSRAALDESLPDFLTRARAHIDAPLAVGFGISTPEQAAEVASHADGVIIGSRLVELADDPSGAEEFLVRVATAMAAR